MADNQQIQNFITALEAATGVSVDADLTAESVTIEDANGDTLEISNAGAISVSDDGNFEVDIISDTVTVEDNGDFEVSDVLSTLTVSDDGNFEVDVISDTVTVSDDGAFDVNSITAVVETTTPSTTAGSSYGVQQTDGTATLVLAANDGRESVLLQNKGSEAVYVGFDNTVSSLKGVEIAAGGTYADDTYTGDLYAITGGGTVNVAFQEIATQ
jgi:hypothetical protein